MYCGKSSERCEGIGLPIPLFFAQFAPLSLWCYKFPGYKLGFVEGAVNMRQLMVVLVLLVGMGVLAGCGGDDGGDADAPPDTGVNEATLVPTPTFTPRAPAPRNKALPAGDPAAFEAPFSVAEYVRQTVQGRPDLPQQGGQVAAYRKDVIDVLVTVYRFEDIERALESVRFTLEGSTIEASVGEPFYGPTVAYGVARDRQGNHIAVWSNDEWFFLVRSSGSVDDLQNFLDFFPY